MIKYLKQEMYWAGELAVQAPASAGMSGPQVVDPARD
jgi:hypothetical protein